MAKHDEVAPTGDLPRIFARDDAEPGKVIITELSDESDEDRADVRLPSLENEGE